MNLFDVTKGLPAYSACTSSTKRYKDGPRSATSEEIAFYLRGLASRAGLDLSSDDISIDVQGMTIGECLAKPEYDRETREYSAPEYATGSYCVPMPGYGRQPMPTCDTLDEAGNVVRTIMLPSDAKGKVAITADYIERASGLSPVKKKRATRTVPKNWSEITGLKAYATDPAGTMALAREVSANAPQPVAAVETAPGPVEPVAPVSVEPEPIRSTLPNPLAMMDAIEALQRQVAALQAASVAAKPAPIAPTAANDAEPIVSVADPDDIGITVSPKRSDAERRAILRAWRMRGEMLQRADLDRRALLAANAAYATMRGERDEALSRSDASEAIAMKAENAAKGLADQLANARKAVSGFKVECDILGRENAQMRTDLATRPGDRAALLEANTTIGKLERQLVTAQRRLAIRGETLAEAA